MNYNMFAIYDCKADAYLIPFYLPNNDVALRVFEDCVNDPEHQWGKHPADYTLFQLGIYDDSTGTHTLIDNKALAVGIELVRSDPAREIVKATIATMEKNNANRND